ncbi:MAG: hypothetical protein C0602_13080 [Denitrovibrio sp.]|nr:MAG: hypothetical protein C0602_13080 [Denitrovibrio sp.]
MNSYKIAEYQGKLESFKEVTNIAEFFEFILPYGIAKVYLTANRRWSFLEKKRRRIALAILINRIIRKFGFNVWDVRSSAGGFMEDFHTMPVIGVISALTTQYAIQEGFVTKESNFTLATFKLCGKGIISAELKQNADKLHDLKLKRERHLCCISKREEGKPALYETAVNTLYQLEESLIAAHAAKACPLSHSA